MLVRILYLDISCIVVNWTFLKLRLSPKLDTRLMTDHVMETRLQMFNLRDEKIGCLKMCQVLIHHLMIKINITKRNVAINKYVVRYQRNHRKIHIKTHSFWENKRHLTRRPKFIYIYTYIYIYYSFNTNHPINPRFTYWYLFLVSLL